MVRFQANADISLENVPLYELARRFRYEEETPKSMRNITAALHAFNPSLYAN
jgi:hypothetical protein